MRGIGALLALSLVVVLTACTAQVDGKGSLPDPKDMVLQTKDLPDWNQSRDVEDKDDEGPSLDDFLGCVGPIVGGQDIAEADSPDFQRNNAEIGSSVRIMRSPDDVRRDIKLYLDPRFGTCITKLLRTAIEKDAPKTIKITVSELKFTKRTAAQPKRLAAIGRSQVTLSGAGRTLPMYLSFALLAGVRSEAFVSFFNVERPISASVENNVLATVANRLA